MVTWEGEFHKDTSQEGLERRTHTGKHAKVPGPTYLVYTYQYNNMRRPRIDAQKRTYHDRRDLDSLPPTVIRFINVGATSKREAIREGRSILLKPNGAGKCQPT